MYWSSTAATTTSLTLSPSTSAAAAPVAPAWGGGRHRDRPPVALPSFRTTTMVARPPRRGRASRSPSPSTSPTAARALVDVGQITRAPRLARPVRVLVPREDHVLGPPATKSTSPSPSRSAGQHIVEHVVKRRGRRARWAPPHPYPRPGRAAAPTRCTDVRLRPHHIRAARRRRSAAARLGFSSPSSTVAPITQTLLRRRRSRATSA